MGSATQNGTVIATLAIDIAVHCVLRRSPTLIVLPLANVSKVTVKLKFTLVIRLQTHLMMTPRADKLHLNEMNECVCMYVCKYVCMCAR
jgi:predicted nuclease of predicted toxin-antitoxin system